MTHTPNSSRHSRSLRPAGSLRSAAKLGLALLSLLSLSAGTVAHAGTVTWDGTAADWFAAPSHWVGGIAPGTGDDAVNNSTAAMTLGQSTTIQSFFSNGAFTLQGGTLSGSLANAAGTITVNNVFTDNGGTISNFTINQGAGGSVVFTGSGNAVSNSIFNSNIDMATNTNALLYMEGAMTANKAINLGTTSNGLQLYGGGSSLTLGGGGSLSGFGTVSQAGGTTLTNNGTVNANSAMNALNVNLSTFDNNATAEATSGATLNLNTNVTNNAGLLTATGGGIVNVTGTLNSLAGNSINGVGGTVNINGAYLNGTVNGVGATELIFNNGGNNLNNDGNGATLNVNLDLATHTDALVYAKGAVTENGAITLGTTSNGLQLYGGGSDLTLSSTGTLTGFGTVSQAGGTTLTNNGTVNANVTGQALAINTTNFVNAGTTEVQNGALLNVTSAVTDSGNILVAKGGTATFGQPVTQTAGLTQVDGTLNTDLSLSGGTLSGTGTVNGNVPSSGTVSAGNSGSPFGTLTVTRTFSQGPNGTLDVGFNSLLSNLLSVNGAILTGGTLDVSYLGAGPYTGSGPFTFLSYGSLTSSITGAGATQYFANETFDSQGNGIIPGTNGFSYTLLNNTGIDALQLQVLTNGAPTPAVPEASTTISLGLLLALGGGGLLAAKRKKAA